MLFDDINNSVLLSQLLPLMMKVIKAGKVSLILEENKQLKVVCECFHGNESSASDSHSCSLQSISLESSHSVPLTIINHVWKYQQNLISSKQDLDDFFNKDSYLQYQKNISFICFPLSYEKKPLGIVYLEKTKKENPFTDEQIEILELLISQIAIMINQTNKYQKVEKYVNSLQEDVKNKNEELYAEFCKCQKTQQQLNEALELNRQIVNNVQEGIIVIDRNFRYQLWNPFMEKLTGISSEDILGKDCHEFLPFVNEQGILNLMKKSFQGETVSSPDLKFYSPNTSEVNWTMEKFSPLRNSQGEIIGVIITVHNVTKHKENQQKLEDKEVRLKLKNNLLQAVSFRLSLHDIINLTVNNLSRCFKNFQVAFLKVDSDTRLQVTHSVQHLGMNSLKGMEFEVSAFPQYWESLKTNTFLAIEDIHKDIRLSPLLNKILTPNTKAILNFPIRKRGHLAGILCFYSPVTHKWNAHEIETLTEISNCLNFAFENVALQEEKISQEKALYQLNIKLHNKNKELQHINLAMTKAMSCISRLDRKGYYLEVNEFYAETLGYTPEEMLLISWQDTVYHEDLPFAIANYKKMQKEGKAEFETRGIRKNGSIFYKQVFLLKAEFTSNGFDGHFCFYKDISERKYNENALRESEKEYRTLVETIPYGIEEIDLNGKIVFSNLAYCKMFGYDETEITQKYIWEINAEAEKIGLKEYVKKIFTQQPKPIPFFGKGLRKNRTTFDLQVDWNYKRNDQGKVIGLISIITDITERLKDQETLKKSEESYRRLLQTADEGIWIIDENNKTTFVNPKMGNILGFTPIEMLRKSLFDFMDEEGTNIAYQNLERRRKGIKEQHDFKFRHKDGSDVWTIISTSPIFDEEGNYKGALAMITDICDRKQAEIALKESEQRYINLVKVLPVGIFRTKNESKCVYVNQKFAEIIGISSQECLGDGWKKYIHPEDQEKVLQKWSEFLNDKIPFQLKYRFLNATGKITWVYTEVVAELDEKGNYIGSIGSITDITEQELIIQELQKTEKSLRETEEKFNQLANNINQAFYIMSSDLSETIYMSSAYERIWGKPVQNMYDNAKDWILSIHPDDINQVLTDLATSEQKYSYEGEYRILREDGEIRWIRGKNFPVYNEVEEISSIVGIAEDITDRHLIKEKLNQTNAEMQSIFEAFPDLFFKVDKEGIILDYKASDNFDSLYTTSDKFLGKQMKEVFPFEVWVKFHYYIEESLKIKKIFSFEYSLIIDEKEDYFEARLVPIQNDLVIIIIRNISDRILAYQQHLLMEEALQKSESRYRGIVEDQTDFICRYDINGVVSYANEAYLRYFNLKKDDLIGKSFFPILPETELKNLKHDLSLITVKNQVYSREQYVRLNDEKIIWQQWINRGIFNNQGELIEYQSVGRDITDLKEIEKNLIKAKEEAESANNAKSAFLAKMSHELRTPLNGILGYAQILLQDNTLTPHQKHEIEIINTCGNHLLTLIKDILDLASIEAGKTQIYPEFFELSSFLLEIAEISELTAIKKNLYFNYQVLSQLPHLIYGDAKRLRQVLLNLLNNAIKFTKKGEVNFKIKILKENQQTNKTKIRFIIQDTGVGIAAEDLEKIFEPFQQVNNYYHENDGRGLGLAISQQILSKMGTSIKVKSKVNKGSVFEFDLEVVYKSLSSHNDEENALNDIIIGYEGSRKTILIVDDSKINLNLLRHILRPLDFTIVEALNGEEGLKKAIECEPDLMIIDLLMPIMDGFQIVQEIRKLPQFNNTTLIACSASVSDSFMKKSLELGYNSFIPKPLKNEQLLEIIKTSLNLDWRYKSVNDVNDNNFNSLTKSDSTLKKEEEILIIPPPETELLKLYDLAKKGLINELITETETIKKTHQNSTQFCQNLLDLCDRFKIKEIRTLLQNNIKS